MEYYYEEDYPDCLGEEFDYNNQPACLTCVWKIDCRQQIETDNNLTMWEIESKIEENNILTML